jgi:hypothetical protein
VQDGDIASRRLVEGVREVLLVTVHNPNDAPLDVAVHLQDATRGPLFATTVHLPPRGTERVEVVWTPEHGGHMLSLYVGDEVVALPGPLPVVKAETGGDGAGHALGLDAAHALALGGLAIVVALAAAGRVALLHRARRRGRRPKG